MKIVEKHGIGILSFFLLSIFILGSCSGKNKEKDELVAYGESLKKASLFEKEAIDAYNSASIKNLKEELKETILPKYSLYLQALENIANNIDNNMETDVVKEQHQKIIEAAKKQYQAFEEMLEGASLLDEAESSFDDEIEQFKDLLQEHGVENAY
ncbi:MAG: hypothetical protein LBP19_10720 [Treponema sp.]|jgi:hypothetical protein|nr:hypothetical protein [Treponema sp.]